ncbi:MAG: hypothetical protein ACR2NZ_00560, partial [Rubripirellula sp.]
MNNQAHSSIASQPLFQSLTTFRTSVRLFVTLFAAVTAVQLFGADSVETVGSGGWLGFRGDGTSAAASSAPTTLDIGADGNVAWKLQMPGRSVAGPIVVGDLVVTTSSSGQDGEVLHVSGV